MGEVHFKATNPERFMTCVIPETMSYKSGSLSLTNPPFTSYLCFKKEKKKYKQKLD